MKRKNVDRQGLIPMRRKDREITKREALSIVKKSEYGILSLASVDGKPYGIPLNYCIMNNALYFHSAMEGRKLELLSQNSSVSFCVVGDTKVLPEKFGMRYESALISGVAQEVTGNEKHQALEGLLKKYSQPFISQGLEMIKTNSRKTRVFKINIHSISGKACR